MLDDIASATQLTASPSDSGKLVQLDATGKVPAAYSSGAVSLSDGRALMLEIADLKGVALNFSEGFADPFDSDTIGLTSTNETYDASNDYYHNPSNSDMTLVSVGVTAASAPTTGRITVQAQAVDTITLNTDLTAEISRDGGTTWTAVTLAAGAVNSSFTLYEGTADISAQPSGTSMKYRVKSLNSKEIRVSGVVLRWS